MPLYIANDQVDELAKQLVNLTGKTKVEVVREALAEKMERIRREPSLIDGIRALQAQIRADGFKRMPDEKEFLDDLSGGI